VRINRQNMGNWQEGAYERLDPLLLLLRKTVNAGICMAMDETRVQVMREEGKAAATESYMWLTKGGPPGKPVVIFEYRPTRAAKHLPFFLEGFVGYPQTDGYEGYDSALAAFPGMSGVSAMPGENSLRRPKCRRRAVWRKKG
jgi:transposase